MTSIACGLRALELEMLARSVSYWPTRDHFAAEARAWRAREVVALAAEALARLN